MAPQELEKAEKRENTNYRFGSFYEGPRQDCRECIPVKEVVGNLSAKVVGQTEQKLVEACDLIRLLLPYGQKKSKFCICDHRLGKWCEGFGCSSKSCC